MGRLVDYLIGYLFGTPIYSPRARWRGAVRGTRHADRIARWLGR